LIKISKPRRPRRLSCKYLIFKEKMTAMYVKNRAVPPPQPRRQKTVPRRQKKWAVLFAPKAVLFAPKAVLIFPKAVLIAQIL